MPPIVALFLGTSMYLNGIFNMNKVKDVLLSIKHDCIYYTNRPENMILQQYQAQGRKITLFYASYIYATVLVYITLPAILLVTNVISTPSNHSEEKSFLYELDYGVDKEQYFYYLYVHSYLATITVANLITCCHTTYMIYAQHAYALFAIISYQLKTIHILDTDTLIDVEDTDLLEKYKNVDFLWGQQQQIYQKVFTCIKEHQNAIKYSNLVESLFTKSLLVQLLWIVLCLTVTGVETVLKVGNFGDMMRFGMFTVAQTVHIFFLCLPGQRLVNHGEEVFAAACEVTWYMLPKKCHNLYRFLLSRSFTPSRITALGLVPMSMETFLMIIRTAMSYFTVLLSVA
ncbi:uncharacterized protein LOC143427224 [Xylocopa sonorina]|uniref:uncharacterized protein LOC143427224 n=1 Tax=Xylocopa sonorina TaxID=1818115 RepID=UPI00403AFD9F